MSKNRIHDAELTEFAINQEKQSIQLKFRRENGECITVKLQEVHVFRGEDLILQNTISRVLIYSHGDIPENRLTPCMEWVSGLSDCASWINEKTQQSWREMLHKGLLDFVIFESSSGAKMMAVCQHIEINPPL